MRTSGGLDFDSCYRAVSSRDRRFDGVFYTAVRTTGIYCRPSCPARTPLAANVTFHRTAAAAQAAGYRACQRCRPDATPGSPEWDVAATVAGRAMRLIADGVVERDGVPGLAARLGYTPRHLTRLLTAELGAGPLALARARRAQHARVLIETGGLSLTEVAFAAGFTSVRQFNDTIREVYATTPSDLRRRAATGAGRPGEAAESSMMRLRLPVRTPFAGRALLAFLAGHAVAGIEAADLAAGWYARTLRLPHGPGTMCLELADDLRDGTIGTVWARFALTDLRDTGAAVERARRLIDADCDPLPVAAALAADPGLRAAVDGTPGLRVPGSVDGAELAVRTVVGQQVSVAGAATVSGRLVAEHGTPYASRIPSLTHLFPTMDRLAEVPAESWPMPRARGRTLRGLAGTLAAGDLDLDRGADRAEVRARLLATDGIGPWSADYIGMRALGDPDVFLPTDAGVRRALARLAATVDSGDPPGADSDADPDAAPNTWRPWRSYALMYLWHSLDPRVAAPSRAAPSRKVPR